MQTTVSRLLDHTGKPFRRATTTARIPVRIKARFDAAQTNEDNRKHWLAADALSAREANSLSVRKTLRERARYEVANNSYAKGIGLTLANHLVGPGPKLRIVTPNSSLNEAVEAAFSEWATAIRLPDQLRIMKLAKYTDGEPFGVLTTNEGLPTSVRLDLNVIECDQVTDPTYVGQWNDPLYVDGIRYDAYYNPVSYDVLKYHPGDGFFGVRSLREYTTLPARSVLHWFRCDRPGQCRGIPELTPALPLFAQLRRFTLATLTAAETAAMFAAMLTAAANPNTDEWAEGEPFETLEIERGMMTTLPTGYDLKQLAAEHPNTTYSDFVKTLLCEVARCLNMPWHLASGDYSQSNYATARLGSQDFRLAVKVERQDCEREVLDPLLAAWLDEAVMIPGLLPAGIALYLSSLPHVWHWPAWDYLDPQTEAAADTERLTNGTTTLAAIASQRGEDWQELIRQQVIEEKFRADTRKEMGMTPAQPDAKEEIEDDGLAEEPGIEAVDLRACGGEGSGVPGPCPAGTPQGRPGKRTKQEQPSEKAQRAKAAHHMVDKDIQRYSEERNEPVLAMHLGGQAERDNAPYDVKTDRDGIELKTMVDNKHGKITMKGSAQDRKADWEVAEGKTMHTVVYDDQKVYNARGPGKHGSAKDREILYRRGAGSIRVKGMHKCKDHAELKKLISAKDTDLPAAARSTPQWQERQRAARARAGKEEAVAR